MPHLTHSCVVLLILSLDEFSQEVAAVGAGEGLRLLREDLDEVIVILHPAHRHAVLTTGVIKSSTQAENQQQCKDIFGHTFSLRRHIIHLK